MAVNLPALWQMTSVLTLIKQAMKKTNRTLWIYSLSLLLLLAAGACKRHPHGAPPGQVKKVTGVHPVSGKANGKATAPGQQKKKNKK
jgi:hypothetical protein